MIELLLIGAPMKKNAITRVATALRAERSLRQKIQKNSEEICSAIQQARIAGVSYRQLAFALELPAGCVDDTESRRRKRAVALRQRRKSCCARSVSSDHGQATVPSGQVQARQLGSLTMTDPNLLKRTVVTTTEEFAPPVVETEDYLEELENVADSDEQQAPSDH